MGMDNQQTGKSSQDDPHRTTPTLRAGPPLAQASGALVLLHGRRASPQDALELGLQLDLPTFSLMAPAAAEGVWYPHWYASPIERHQPWLDSALRRVDGLLEECRQAGLAPEQVGLLGFSQGTCVALEYVTRHPGRCAAVVGLSGAMVGSDDMGRSPTASLEGTRIFLGCGASDPYFPKDRVLDAVEFLAACGAQVRLSLYAGLGHTVNEDEIRTARDLFSGLARPRTT
jgi:predicted esterase